MEVKPFNQQGERYVDLFLEIGEGFVFDEWQILEYFLLKTGKDLKTMKVRFLLPNLKGEGVYWSECYGVCINSMEQLSMWVGADKKILDRDHSYKGARLLEVYEDSNYCGKYRFAGGGFEYNKLVEVGEVDNVSGGIGGRFAKCISSDVSCGLDSNGSSCKRELEMPAVFFGSPMQEDLWDAVVESVDRWMSDGTKGVEVDRHGWTGFSRGKKSKTGGGRAKK